MMPEKNGLAGGGGDRRRKGVGEIRVLGSSLGKEGMKGKVTLGLGKTCQLIRPIFGRISPNFNFFF